MAKICFTGLMMATLAAWFVLLRPAVLGGTTGYVMVSGISMEPTYYTGDLVLTRRLSEYRTGDVVAFRIPAGEQGGGGIVIHRVVGGSAADGYELRGDNKDANDPWRPKPGDIVGKAWVHVPGGGRWFEWLREPLNLAVVIGGVSVFSVLSGREVKKRRRRRGGHVRGNEQSGKQAGGQGPGLPAPAWAIALGGGFALLAVVGAVAAFGAFRQATETSRYVESLRYEQQGTFEYTVGVTPATLYPEGTIGPVVAPPAGAKEKAPSVPPVYTKLAKSIEVGFAYALSGSLPPAVSGEVSARLEIRAGESGWTKSQELLPPTPFQGAKTDARVSIDLAAVQALIDAIEKETGYNAPSYDLVVVPTVRLQGQLGAHTIDETYAPAFTVKYTKTQITLDTELRRAEPKSIGATVREQQSMTIAGLSMPVKTARLASVVGVAVALSGVAGTVGLVLLGVGQDEASRARLRYGTTVLAVHSGGHNGSHVVQVRSMEDLAKLAQRDGRIVFREDTDEGGVYFVPDGGITYEYEPARRQSE